MKPTKRKLIIYFTLMLFGIVFVSEIDRFFISFDHNVGFQSVFAWGTVLPFTLLLVPILQFSFSGIKLIPTELSENSDEYRKIIGNMMFLLLAISLFTIFCVWLFNDKIRYFGASQNMLDVLRMYMPIYVINILIFGIISLLQLILIIYDDFKRYIISISVNLISRTLAGYVFIVGLELSNLGVILASFLSSIIVLGFLIQRFVLERHGYGLKISHLKPDFEMLFRMIRAGASTFLVSIVITGSLAIFFLNLKNYSYNLIAGRANILYYILLALVAIMSGLIIGAHFAIGFDQANRKRLMGCNIVVFVSALVVRTVTVEILAIENLQNIVERLEVLDVINTLLEEYNKVLVVLIVIALVNALCVALSSKDTIVRSGIKCILCAVPLAFICQPLCLAFGIGNPLMETEFFNGCSYHSYEYFGAHLMEQDGKKGCMFRVYAPNAQNVSLVSDINNWEPIDMDRDTNGVYSVFVPGIKENDQYKYKIEENDGETYFNIDPYGYSTKTGDYNNAVVYDMDKYQWSDEEWMESRSVDLDRPINIYEIHLGSWKTKEDGTHYTYAELKEELIPYLKEHEYTHVEFLPISEHLIYESWGYLTNGYFAATSRYGTPDELKSLIDELHRNEIGVIFDFVDYHYEGARDGLHEFDGTSLYGYEDEELSGTIYGSLKFGYNKDWVRSFLFSNVNFWLEEYHFDGIRVDAVHYSILWNEEEREDVRVSGVKYIKDLNSNIKELHPDVLLIAEDTAAIDNMTDPIDQGGFGFDLKWNVGMTHNMLEFMQMGPEERKQNANKVLDSVSHFFEETYINSISHDDVNPPGQGVNENGNILSRMWGSYEDQLRQYKLLYTFYYAHPGKKLTFMGSEFGQYDSWETGNWKSGRSLDWDLLETPENAQVLEFVDMLHNWYCSTEELYSDEYEVEHMAWLSANRKDELIYDFSRINGDKKYICVFNFSTEDCNDFEIELGENEKIKEIINSDDAQYGGGTVRMDGMIEPTNRGSVNQVIVKIPRLSAVVYEIVK